MTRPPDLLVVSHLRWTWVWQRPQHLISRLAAGRRVWFVEEPMAAGDVETRVRTEDHGAVTRVWLEVPGEPELVLGDEGHVGFGSPRAAPLAAALDTVLPRGAAPVVWLYTPLAFPHVGTRDRAALVYDVMDDLGSFRFAPPTLERLRRTTLAAADLVLAGGRSLYAGVRDAAPERAFLFPSGVDTAHYARARGPQGRPRPVAGYVGVIDERVDLELVAGLARALPDWDVELVGPLAKLDPEILPRVPNLRYPGMQPYERLPEVMAGFDVGLMPFARSEATRAISPTKTLEYLAAGLPVVSTRIPDVVADHSDVVALADDAAGFAAACRQLLTEDPAARARAVAPTLARAEWDAIAGRIRVLIDQAVHGQPLIDPGAPPSPTAARAA